MLVEYIENTQDDLMPVNAARVSMNKHSTKFTYRADVEKGSDEGLIYYLAEHNHWTPFAQVRETFIFPEDPCIVDKAMPNDFQTDLAGLVMKKEDNGSVVMRQSLYGWIYYIRSGYIDKFEKDVTAYLSKYYPVTMKAFEVYNECYGIVLDIGPSVAHDRFVAEYTDPAFVDVTMRETVPIFVARQRFKHKVGFVENEISRRYVDDEPSFFIMTNDDWRARPEKNIKQGSGGKLDALVSQRVNDIYDSAMIQAATNYRTLLSYGVAPEQARMILPQSMYTSYYVTGSLLSWARLCKQRLDHHAQIEIRELAAQENDIINTIYPELWHEAKCRVNRKNIM